MHHTKHRDHTLSISNPSIHYYPYHSSQISRKSSIAKQNSILHPEKLLWSPKDKGEVKINYRNTQEAYDRTLHKVRINLTESEKQSSDCGNNVQYSAEVEIQPKVLQKSQQLVYQALVRKYQQILETVSAPKELSLDNIIQVLNGLGYLQQPIINAEDLRLVSGAYYMLGGRPSRGVKRENLLLFLLAISNIQFPGPSSTIKPDSENLCSGLHRDEQIQYKQVPIEIGAFDSEGNWLYSMSEQQTIKKLFKKLLCNKISNKQPMKKQSSQEILLFKPSILDHSRELVCLHRQRIKQKAKINGIHSTKFIRGVAGASDIPHKVTKSRLQIQLKERDQKELKQCTFKPSVNKPRRTMRSESGSTDRCHLLFELARQRSLSNASKARLSTTDEIQIQQLKECTFKPQKTKLKIHNQNVSVKNCDKVVNRMVEGRHQRLVAAAIKDRGYPKQISNWSKFVHHINQPKTISSKPTCNNIVRRPLTTIEIKMCEAQQQNLEVYEGDSLENLTCKLLVRNKLNYQYFPKLIRLIGDVLEESGQVIIKNGFVYQREHTLRY